MLRLMAKRKRSEMKAGEPKKPKKKRKKEEEEEETEEIGSMNEQERLEQLEKRLESKVFNFIAFPQL